MMENVISAKLIASGNVFEFFLYDEDIYADDKKRHKRITEIKVHEIPLSLDDKLLVHQSAMLRAARNVKRLVNANAYAYMDSNRRLYKPVFVTITFRENVSDVAYCNAQFLLFIKRLTYYLFRVKVARLKYIGVLEFQERGALHYHIMFFNLPYIPNGKQVLEDLWDLGFVHLIAIDDVTDVGSYMAKYMTKGNNDERLLGFKSYQASQGLFRPFVLTDFFKIAEILNMLPSELTFSKDLSSEYVGNFKYIRVDLNRTKQTGLRYINPDYVHVSPVDNLVLTSLKQGVQLKLI